MGHGNTSCDPNLSQPPGNYRSVTSRAASAARAASFKRRNRKLTFDQLAAYLPPGFPQERERRQPIMAWIRRLGGSLPVACLGGEHSFFLITCVRLQSASFIRQTADRSSGDVI